MKKIEAESKSQQRRIQQQTGQDAPLSARAAAAIAEHLPPVEAEAADPIKDALRPGRKGGPSKTTPVKSPILGLTEDMDERHIMGSFEHLQNVERTNAQKALDLITATLGSKVNALDKKARAEFDEIKKSETAAKEKAQKIYQTALRAAKSMLDQNNNMIAEEHEKRRVEARTIFDENVTLINVEMTETKSAIAADYAVRVGAAVAELQPFVKAARARAEVRIAALRKKAEEAAAKASEAPSVEAKIPASPHFAGASTVIGAAGAA